MLNVNRIYMRTAKEIRKYLKQQKWYNEYTYNAKKFALYIREDKNYCNDHVRGYEKSRTISGAFLWDGTQQGIDVWSLRDGAFCEWYNKGEDRYEKRRY